MSEFNELKWNPKVIKNAMNIENDLFCLECHDNHHYNIINKLINIGDKEERLPFLPIEPGDNALLIFDPKRELYLGYLTWNFDLNEEYCKYVEWEGLNKPYYHCNGGGEILRLLYIVKEERRKGYASKLVKFWVENYAMKTHNRFGVEAMIESPIVELLIKLGYVKRVATDKRLPLNCYYVPSC